MPDPAIVIDFDGTICEHRYPAVGDPMPGVRQALTRFREMGLRIVIHTVRTASYWRLLARGDEELDPVHQIDVVREYMARHNLPYDEIHMADKPLAVAYIDDRAYRFEQNWLQLAMRVESDLRGEMSHTEDHHDRRSDARRRVGPGG